MSTLAYPVTIHLDRAYSPDAFLAAVYDELHKAEKELNPYRLVALLAEGKLSRDQLREFGTNQWWFVNEIQKTHGYIYQNCPIEEARKELIKNLMVEEGPPGPTHPELWVQFCEKGLGLTRAELESSRPLATTVAALRLFLWITLTRSWLEGIGAVVIAGEKGGDKSRNNPAYDAANSLHDRYGMGWDALEFFTVHAELEQGEKAAEHGEIGPSLLQRYVTTKEDQEKVLEAIWEGVMVHKVYNDGIYHHILNH
jgi:pyrroloquinoline quinone (PQQ) biosynthesis protein C